MQKIEFLLSTSLLTPASNEALNSGLQSFDQLIGIDEVMRILSVKRTSLYKGMKNGVFPEPMRFSKRMIRWRLTDVMAVVRQSKPFIPNPLAANDSKAVCCASGTPEHSKSTLYSKSTLHSISAHKSQHLEKLEERRLELLANVTSSKLRAKVPIKRHIPKN
ncbi:AlpA family phage regulatory protein [Comamonas sp. Y33R10-2]|uniref:helix-turn-helix transcriptional regulator n=1 Tax=Comamonas sp. Y33R10-2 TaxID=2853257 RepID=UPI001C5C9D5B|nr:AlpA family phage regulatory protein [Comamonas sp. Y33R10-2]QXZ08378.1 AlpA family phage regulatory protein [Comamonas sp. Y33R10-2]